MTLTEFLLARIAEREAVAREALREFTSMPAGTSPKWESHRQWERTAVGEFIRTHGPEWVLAECEAKRRIVARHESSEDTRGAGQYRDNEWPPYCEYDSTDWPCPDIADLSAVYADHPDYDQEWRA